MALGIKIEIEDETAAVPGVEEEPAENVINTVAVAVAVADDEDEEWLFQEAQFLATTAAQAHKYRFPPGCQVVCCHFDKVNQNCVTRVQYGTVCQVGIDLNPPRDTLFRVTMVKGGWVVMETDCSKSRISDKASTPSWPRKTSCSFLRVVPCGFMLTKAMSGDKVSF